jgi:hypothetical protein
VITPTVPETVVATSVDWPICRCGATPESGFVPCDETGRELEMSKVGSLYKCTSCRLIVDVSTYDSRTQTMRTAGEARRSPTHQAGVPAGG